MGDGDWIESQDQSREGIRLVQTGNIGNGEFLNRPERAHFISEATFSALHCEEIFPGDVLISRLPEPIGRSCIVPKIEQRMITAVDCSIARINEKSCIKNFFVYFSQSLQYISFITQSCTGTTRSRISRKNLAKVPIPLPPLEEQKRIVAILDAAFEKIDAVKRNAEQNLANAKELFQRVLDEEMTPKEGWEKATIKDVCIEIVDCPHSTPQKSLCQTQYPCIRTSELKNGHIFWETMQYLDEQEYKKRIKRLAPMAGDIVYGREGTYGDAVCLPDTHHFCLGQRTMLFRPNSTKINSFFLLYLMISDFVYTQAVAKNSGCGVGHINVKDIKKFVIQYPLSLFEQKKLVDKIDYFSGEYDVLSKQYTNIVNHCADLKQQILAKAFNGEL